MQVNHRREFIKATALAGSALIFPGLNTIASSFADLTEKAGNTSPDLLALGLLDITKAPYNADPSGGADCTIAIQQAIIDARTKRLVCFFPTGTFLISDTLNCEVPVYKLPIEGMAGKLTDSCGKYQDGDNMTQHYWSDPNDRIVLLGSTKGARPVIKLASGSNGFGDTANPKFVVKIWAQSRNDRGGTIDPLNPCLVAQPIWGKEQPNISFNNVFKGIDIDLNGNSGAIGIRHTGSQGCYMMDSKIIATGAHAGLNNCPGQGGGTYNIEVQGGEYGIKLDPNCRYPILTSCIFRGQTQASVYTIASSGYNPSVFVGCLFEPDSIFAIDLSLAKSYPGINLIDCVAKLNSNGVLVKTASGGENIFLENTTVKGINKIHTYEIQPMDAAKWNQIAEYSSCKAGAKNLINGVISNSTRLTCNESSEPDYNTLHEKHWTLLPSFEDPDAVNVRDFGATGNGQDDTDAFKKALAVSNKVFVPKGTYKINETLVLGARNHLFGIPKIYAAVSSSITTADDAEATSGLSFVTIIDNITWKAGKGLFAFASGNFSFSGNGGGRFYGLSKQKTIGNNSRPVYIYSHNIERVMQNPMCEIRNADNVKIFYLKVEAGTSSSGNSNDYNTPLRIIDSRNIGVYCVSGVVETKESRPMIDVVNSINVMVSQVKSLDTAATSTPNIRETIGSFTAEIPNDTMVALYLRNLTTGIKTLSEGKTKVYPNPFKDNFTIETTDLFDRLTIHDMGGHKITDMLLSQEKILKINFMSDKPAGVYLITLVRHNENKVFKVVKN